MASGGACGKHSGARWQAIENIFLLLVRGLPQHGPSEESERGLKARKIGVFISMWHGLCYCWAASIGLVTLT